MCLGGYEEIMPESAVTLKNFIMSYAQVCTRTFGHELPSTIMVPLIDNLNHSDDGATHEFINVKEHLAANPESEYFSQTKFTYDYTPIFKNAEPANAFEY